MEALKDLIADLERQVKRGSRKDRVATFKQVVDLYFGSVDLQEDEHVDFFGDVFSLLVDHVDTSDLAQLGQRIAPVERAPAKLVRRLANDDAISVAGPVIAQSHVLTSDDLIMLAQTKSQEHLSAIGDRRRIDCAVTSVLIERADDDVARKIADNRGAEFSTDGFSALAQRALRNDDLAEAVGSRADVPARVLRALVSQANDTARARILAAAGEDMKAEIKSALASAPKRTRQSAAARALVADLQYRGRLDECQILEFANSRRIDEAVAGLELISGIPADVIHQFMTHIAVEAMPVVCKASGLSWATAHAVMGLCGRGGSGLSDEDRRRALTNYAKLTQSTSQKLLRFWFVRGSNRESARRSPGPEHGKRPRDRNQERREVELPAAAMVGGKHVADLTVEDMSTDGAKLRLAGPCSLPDKFVLCLWANTHVYRNCEIRWRTREHIGVRFAA